MAILLAIVLILSACRLQAQPGSSPVILLHLIGFPPGLPLERMDAPCLVQSAPRVELASLPAGLPCRPALLLPRVYDH